MTMIKALKSSQLMVVYVQDKDANTEITSDKFTSLKVGVSRRVPEEPAPGDGQSRGPGEDEPLDLISGPFRAEPLRGITHGKPFGLHSGEDFKYPLTS